MNVIVNGKHSSLPEGLTLDGYLAQRALDPRVVIVELNESIVPRENWTGLVLAEGDRLEIVSFVGGG